MPVCICEGDDVMMMSCRARYLLVLVFGEDHPEMATCDSNIAIILHTLKDYKNSHHFLFNTLTIHTKSGVVIVPLATPHEG